MIPLALLCVCLCLILGSQPAAAQHSNSEDLRPKVSVVPPRSPLGGTVVVVISSPGEFRGGRVRLFNREVPLSPSSERAPFRYKAYLGIDLRDPVGRHDMTLTWMDRRVGSSLLRIPFWIEQREFPTEMITLPKGARTLLRSDVLREENRRLGRVLSRFHPKKAWQGPFLLPVKAPISSPFGLRRVYGPGNIASWQHKGVDFKAGAGTPVVAPNNGVVGFCSALKAHGNTAIIDHGLGIFSILIHLRDMTVSSGQVVRKGQLVGHVGSTGIATGAHLHWGLSIGGVRVDPIPWTRMDMGR